MTTTQMIYILPIAHSTHRIENVAWNACVCLTCGLDDSYTAIERPCAGTRRYACNQGGYWQQARDEGECTETFASRSESEQHFLSSHV